MTLVKLLFMNPSLHWNRPGDHVELFAGTMSVTRGEWQEPSGFQQKNLYVSNIPNGKPIGSLQVYPAIYYTYTLYHRIQYIVYCIEDIDRKIK